jgi:SAM-dependent methyltransferase
MASRHGHVIDADIRDIRDLFSPDTFDGIWAQASLVHLSRTETEHLLRDAESLLRPNGLFYASVPAFGETGWVNESDGRRWYTVWPDDDFEGAVSAVGLEIEDVNPGPYIEVWARKGGR